MLVRKIGGYCTVDPCEEILGLILMWLGVETGDECYTKIVALLHGVVVGVEVRCVDVWSGEHKVDGFEVVMENSSHAIIAITGFPEAFGPCPVSQISFRCDEKKFILYSLFK